MAATRCWGIVPAAGIGRRFGTDKPKQYTRVAGKSILQHSLECLLRAPQINTAVVCLAEDDVHWQQEEIAKHANVETTLGGDNRAQSVFNGLEFLLSKSVDENEWVLVHDAARPFLHESSLQQLIETCSQNGVGAILATPSVNTLKQVNAGGAVLLTLDRTTIWQAQTPQMFRLGELHKALATAIANNEPITDEASAMEIAGHPVSIVEGNPYNLKVTTQDDIRLLEFLMQTKQSTMSV